LSENTANKVATRRAIVAIVILPMVLQIRETMVLQSGELDGKARSSPFEVFGLVEALMGKRGFAEKLHLKLKWFLMGHKHTQKQALGKRCGDSSCLRVCPGYLTDPFQIRSGKQSNRKLLVTCQSCNRKRAFSLATACLEGR
jgi:hypothetical protein